MIARRCRVAHLLLLLTLLAAGLFALSGCDLFRADPVAVLASSRITGPAPLTIDFDLSYSVHPDGRPLTYTLVFGDDSDPAAGTELGIIVSHTYADGGAYDAVLTVTDDVGVQATDALTITVSADGPDVGTDVGMQAPEFTAPTTDGAGFALSSTRGQVVILDFWGAWCAPCRNSLPHLDQLVQSYGEQGLVVVLISTDTIKDDSVAHLTQHDYTDFVSLWQPGGRFTAVAEQYGVLSGGSVGIPHSFLIDRQGVIRWRGHPLNLPEDILESLL